jgi:hypothetical protein
MFAPVRTRSLKPPGSGVSSRASERNRTRANAEPCHSCHAANDDQPGLERAVVGVSGRNVLIRPGTRRSSSNVGSISRAGRQRFIVPSRVLSRRAALYASPRCRAPSAARQAGSIDLWGAKNSVPREFTDLKAGHNFARHGLCDVLGEPRVAPDSPLAARNVVGFLSADEGVTPTQPRAV